MYPLFDEKKNKPEENTNKFRLQVAFLSNTTSKERFTLTLKICFSIECIEENGFSIIPLKLGQVNLFYRPPHLQSFMLL